MNTEVLSDKNNRFFSFSTVALILICFPVIYDLIIDWYTDPNYSHGFLVPVISGYLIWKKRRELAEIKKSNNNLGLIPIMAGIIFFILGNAASEYFTVRFSMVIILFGLILYYYGGGIVRRTWFEIIFLLFMIPIPYIIYFSATFPMQLLASKVTVFLLDGLGMPVIRQGNIIHLANQSLEVADACSGLRSLISLLALGAIYSYLTQKRFVGKILLFLATIPIAVIGNIFRVFLTSIIVYTSEIDITAEPTHTIMGASVFVTAFVLLLITGTVLKKVFE
ncbi:MAG: exosortase [Candidatus Zixiibacteriota bacterium]|nr:MAG: exosortase [candidate division Zixibacteria bacterium]